MDFVGIIGCSVVTYNSMESVEVTSYSMYTYLGRCIPIPIRQPNIIPVGEV